MRVDETIASQCDAVAMLTKARATTWGSIAGVSKQGADLSGIGAAKAVESQRKLSGRESRPLTNTDAAPGGNVI
jgi:hypothetical protein